jgi:hypothetical protein
VSASTHRLRLKTAVTNADEMIVVDAMPAGLKNAADSREHARGGLFVPFVPFALCAPAHAEVGRRRPPQVPGTAP